MAPRLPHPVQRLRMITAAASQVKLDNRGKANAPVRERWQSDAWDMIDLIPEAGQAVTFLANVVSGVRLFIAAQPDDPSEPPGPAEAGAPGVAQAWEVLDRLRWGSVQGGLGGLLYSSVFNLKVPGEYWLLGEPEVRGDPFASPPIRYRPERWDVRSIDEVEVKRDHAIVKDTPQDKGRKVPIVPEDPSVPAPDDAAFLLRVYDRHPRYTGLARSSLRAALSQCDELLLLGKCVRVAARRFLAGNGMLLLPAGMDLPGSPDEGDEGEDSMLSPVMRRLGKAMLDSMVDESNPDSLVPILTMMPGELIEKLQHLTFGAALDPEVRELAIWIQGRLGAGLDLPIEQLTGIAKVNHWGAWQIDGASWARYGQPTTRLIVDSWTEGLLWQQLEDNYGVPREVARTLRIWFDPADAIMDPDESKTADELFDRGAISWDSYRERKGAGKDEVPTPEELAERASLGLMKGSGNNAGPVPNAGQVPAATASLNGHSALYLANESALLANGHHPVTAGARKPLGRKLMEIDRALRTRLQEASEAALRRALQAAGARVRSRAQSSPNIAAAISGVPAHLVVSRLGPTVTASVLATASLTEDDLLQETIDEFAARWDTLTTRAQEQARAAIAAEFDLSAEDLDELAVRQDRNRNEAWAWFAASLLGLARTRLHDPTPAAPSLGEHDTSTSVPTSMLREAMARAGGGGGATIDEAVAGPAGGVATGVDVMAIWQASGQVIGGWEWVHGDPQRDFPAHRDLDGVQFATWQDPVLTVRPEDSWLDVTHYRPGDHDYCTCDFFAVSMADAEADSEPAMA